MFENESSSDLLRQFTQQDILARSIRVGLSLAGPVGGLIGEFLTEFVPGQRVDRLHDFVEKLADRLAGIEEQFKERLATSSGFAALAEQATLSAVRTASDEHRTDLSELIKHGLSQSDAAMIAEEALLRLRDRLNDVQVLLLMSYGNFRRVMGDAELKAFQDAHPGVFSPSPPTKDSPDDERRRWTMREHYESEIEALGLLRDTEGIAKSGARRKYQITPLGRLLLEAIGRYRDPLRRT
jgi:hypothetical protein